MRKEHLIEEKELWKDGIFGKVYIRGGGASAKIGTSYFDLCVLDDGNIGVCISNSGISFLHVLDQENIKQVINILSGYLDKPKANIRLMHSSATKTEV